MTLKYSMMPHTVEPAYHPKDKMCFLLDWLVTLKCNYDCAYCNIGPDGHDNSTSHPDFDRCMRMLDQMYAYVDVMMKDKKPAFRDVIMNIYGGESVYHPRILDIVAETTERYRPYADRWRLRRRMTTNGTANVDLWKRVCEHVDGFTMSYHSTGPDKLKQVFKTNLLYLMEIKKEHDVVAMMYPDDRHWQDCIDFMRWSKDNGVAVRAKMLDGLLGVYSERQLGDLAEFIAEDELRGWDTTKRIDKQTRGCCGGRKMCLNGDRKDPQFLVPRGKDGFHGWHCSANQFFLHGNNVSGTYYTNKDCNVIAGGKVGHIATLDTMDQHIDQLKEIGRPPTLVCAQRHCHCGTCAPKSLHRDELEKILAIYNN